ncbi:hypothetical protein DERP_004602 [Dermatophagoides pteronyssinus]|uniref:Uncharacterized protein n=1 Tax=Dermatophagoides pteronyssinus TaxID=6956 RepID=A0ABQ8JP85_DERPT|nr:hypothetical protein DERP_004602 [Dermatophagoides pteronyssinus]
MKISFNSFIQQPLMDAVYTHSNPYQCIITLSTLSDYQPACLPDSRLPYNTHRQINRQAD